MRKTVVDGSNTSGFQRTTLISTGGMLETSSEPVGISYYVLRRIAQESSIVMQPMRASA